MQNNRILLLIFAVISAVTFVGTLIATPILIVRLPADYFAHQGRRRKPWLQLHPLLRVVMLLGKNMLGVILLLAGVMMLVLPGQGILTILIGMTLIDFPGKFRLERWVVKRQPVRRSINWLRFRAGRPALELDTASDPAVGRIL
ncbi:hypothetical protein JXA02_05895 [candidate division KSB1 bacterium]|nr:hypothetical protein [candidate division KSB1 bacterium]RQW07664.1 MAG: hypothetical protein EH222_06800 [candidate division KSB1 bacterium]